MNLTELLATMEVSYKGRKPGMMATKDPHKLLTKAREMYADDKTFSKHLAQECMDEAPHIKGPTWHHLSPSQQHAVATRIHSKGVSRLRATKLVEARKSKKKSY